MRRGDLAATQIAVTMGDGGGIGPEVIFKALASAPWPASWPRPVVYGSREVFEHTARWLSASSPGHRLSALSCFDSIEALNEVDPEEERLALVEVGQGISGVGAIRPGQSAPAAARLQLCALERAIEDAKRGQIEAIVTAPWNKALFRLIGAPAVGHTEVLAEAFKAPRHVMMLAGDRLRVALATVHVPLCEVSAHLTEARLEATLHTTVEDLRRWFGIARPHVAVCGLNPHAGEQGVMGSEESERIAPTVARVASALGERARLVGPLPADTLFARYHGQGAPYDAVVCMYHDQGLIPLKMAHFGRSANLTLGLPTLRTSVDHGTAYDIAGRGVADASSMRYALELAVNLLQRRAR